MSPKTLGRFKIIRLVERGASGCVYLAHDPMIDRRVVIKALGGLEALSEVEREMTRGRFLREARAAGRLSHPNIVTIFDVGEDGGTPFNAMEFLDGESLAAHTDPPDLLPLPEIVSLMAQACDALDYAHTSGIVHRGIKPANLMVLPGGILKIAEFGLAARPETSLPADGGLVGTPYYMAPEQIRGAAVDGRSDLFSLGVVLQQLVTGRLPFPGDSIHTVIHRILSEPPAEVGGDPQVPRPIRDLLRHVLEKDPARRPQSGEALRQELIAAGAAAGIVAHESPSERSLSPASSAAGASAAGESVPLIRRTPHALARGTVTPTLAGAAGEETTDTLSQAASVPRGGAALEESRSGSSAPARAELRSPARADPHGGPPAMEPARSTARAESPRAPAGFAPPGGSTQAQPAPRPPTVRAEGVAREPSIGAGPGREPGMPASTPTRLRDEVPAGAARDRLQRAARDRLEMPVRPGGRVVRASEGAAIDARSAVASGPTPPMERTGPFALHPRRGRRALGAATVAAAFLITGAAAYYLLVLSHSGAPAASPHAGAESAAPPELADAGPTIRVVAERSAALFLDGKPLSGPAFRLVKGDDARHVLRAETGCRAAEKEFRATAGAAAEIRLDLAPERVRIPVSSSPPGAKVKLNGKPVPGATPLTIDVDRCADTRVEVSLAGYRTLEYRSAAGDPAAPIAAALASVAFRTQEPGTLRVAKGPYEGEVFVDGRRIGSAGGSFKIAAGARRVALVSDALFVRFEQRVQIPAGGELLWKPTWPALGAITVQATPTNCSVEVRSKNETSFRYLDDVPIVRYRLASGAYTVRATLRASGRTQERNVEVLPGTTAQIDFTFL